MPALLKWGLVLIVPDAILHVLLTIILVRFWTSFLSTFLAPLERRFAGISVFSVFGAAARTCF
jgi:hypothetical protein